jgi:hypothetical protein
LVTNATLAGSEQQMNRARRGPVQTCCFDATLTVMADINPYQAPAAQLEDPVPGLAGCPKCGAQSASKVGYNWWGGALGPRLFHVVKCNECRTQYNGRTGAKLTKVIIVYQGVVVVIALLVVWMLKR